MYLLIFPSLFPCFYVSHEGVLFVSAGMSKEAQVQIQICLLALSGQDRAIGKYNTGVHKHVFNYTYTHTHTRISILFTPFPEQIHN